MRPSLGNVILACPPALLMAPQQHMRIMGPSRYDANRAVLSCAEVA